jgi:hypothetical protein
MSPVFRDINNLGSREIMKTIFVLALITAACVCSDDSSETEVEEEDENSKLSYCAGGEPAHTSTPGQCSQADRQGYNKFMKNFRSDKRLELREMGKRAKEERKKSEIKSLLKRLKQERFYFIPKDGDKALSRSFLRKTLGLKTSASDNLIMKAHSKADKSYSFFLGHRFMSPEVQEAFEIMDILRYEVLKWPWS